MIEWVDGNVIHILETSDFPYELRITMEASDKMATEFLFLQTFAGMQKPNASFQWSFLSQCAFSSFFSPSPSLCSIFASLDKLLLPVYFQVHVIISVSKSVSGLKYT